MADQFERLRGSMEQEFDGLSAPSSVSGNWDDEAEDNAFYPDTPLSLVFRQCFTLDSKAIMVGPDDSVEDFLTRIEVSSHPRHRRDTCVTASFELAAQKIWYSTKITHTQLGELGAGPNGSIDMGEGISPRQVRVAFEAALGDIEKFIMSGAPVIARGLSGEAES
jgi:hypothetical protein